LNEFEIKQNLFVFCSQQECRLSVGHGAETCPVSVQYLRSTLLRIKGTVPAPRHVQTALVQGDKMYVFGGYGNSQTYLNDLFVFDFRLCKWSSTMRWRNLPPKRHSHSAAIHGNAMYIFGGATLNTTVLNGMLRVLLFVFRFIQVIS
jgi:hypothetical protein